MAKQEIIIEAKKIGDAYADKMLEGKFLSQSERASLFKVISGSFADGYINGYDAKAETPDIKPASTRREVAQMTKAQLAVYAQKLFDAGITGMDLDSVLHNLEATQTWLKQDLYSQDASLVARCALFNITI